MEINLAEYTSKKTKDNLPILEKIKDIMYVCDNNYVSQPINVVDMMEKNFSLSEQDEEYVYIICFNNKFPIAIMEISHGCSNCSVVKASSVYKKALLAGASFIILVHNHPSGITQPSKDDYLVVEKLKESGKILDCPLMDSLIIGGNTYYSFKENSLL